MPIKTTQAIIYNNTTYLIGDRIKIYYLDFKNKYQTIKGTLISTNDNMTTILVNNEIKGIYTSRIKAIVGVKNETK